MEVAAAGGVHALVMLARTCKFEGVQEQVLCFYFLCTLRNDTDDDGFLFVNLLLISMLCLG